MKCERCAAELGKDVNMEDLGGGQFQCPDCRACVVPDQPPAVAQADQPLVPLPPNVTAGEPVLKLLTNQDDTMKSYVFSCPGCGKHHAVCVENRSGQEHPVWKWNGSLDKPTFQPSILQQIAWADKPQTICHSYVTDGRIQFLHDCTHDKAGQTLDLPPCDW